MAEKYPKNIFPEGTVPCKWCDEETPSLGTKMCDRCWELDSRIKIDLDLAIKMVYTYLHNLIMHK